MKMWKDYS